MSKRQADELRESLSKFGVCQPIVVNADYQVIGGHQRLKVLQGQRVGEVDAYVPSRPLSEKEASELAIRLNKISGEWDMDMLANEFEVDDLVESGFELSELGIGNVDIGEPEERTEKPCKLIITFPDAESLKGAESAIEALIDNVDGAFCKVVR